MAWWEWISAYSEHCTVYEDRSQAYDFDAEKMQYICYGR